MIHQEGKNKEDFRLTNLNSYHQGRDIEMSSNLLTLAKWLLLNCQSIYSLFKHQKLIRIMTAGSFFKKFLVELWLF